MLGKRVILRDRVRRRVHHSSLHGYDSHGCTTCRRRHHLLGEATADDGDRPGRQAEPGCLHVRQDRRVGTSITGTQDRSAQSNGRLCDIATLSARLLPTISPVRRIRSDKMARVVTVLMERDGTEAVNRGHSTIPGRGDLGRCGRPPAGGRVGGATFIRRPFRRFGREADHWSPQEMHRAVKSHFLINIQELKGGERRVRFLSPGAQLFMGCTSTIALNKSLDPPRGGRR